MAAVATALAERRSGDVDTGEDGWHGDVRVRALARRPVDPERPRRVGRVAWLVALLLHLVLVVGLRVALRQQPRAPATDQVLRVTLLDEPIAEPALPSPAPSIRPLVTTPARRHRAATALPRSEAPAKQVPPEPDSAPHLFDEGGAAALPRDIVTQLDGMQPRPDFVARRYDPSPLLMPKRPLKVRPNHFAAMWAGSDGKPLSETIWEPLTFVAEFRAPWGGRYACGLILVLFACADIPDKAWNPPQTWAPASVLDER